MKQNNGFINIVKEIDNDEILTNLIINLRNKINNENIFYYKNIIHLACNKITDPSNLINHYITNSKKEDFHFLLEVFELKINSKEINKLADNFFANETFNKIIKENLRFKKFPSYFNIERLVKVAIINNNYSLLKEIIYSRYVNYLNFDLMIKASKIVAKQEKENYLDIIEELPVIKKDENKIVDISKAVIEIYQNIYINNLYEDDFHKHLMNLPEHVLRNYSNEELKRFIDSLNHNYINLNNNINLGHDIVSALIKLNKTDLALAVFNKDNYQPINKKIRDKEINSKEREIKEFAQRLNYNINLALNNNYYELVLEMLLSKKIDSLNVFTLYKIIKTVDKQKNVKSNNNFKICQLILDTVLLKISEEKLIIYRTAKSFPFFDEKSSFYLSKDDSLDIINEIINNKNASIYNILDDKADIWTKNK